MLALLSGLVAGAMPWRARCRERPPDRNDEAAVKAVTGVYQSGLANLKKLVEAR